MASTSTSTPYSSATVVLPSIHEMFPEHLMHRTVPRARARPAPSPAPGPMFPRSHYVPSPPPPPHPSFSFDVLKSDPRAPSLQHIASSRPTPTHTPAHHRRQALPAVRTHTHTSPPSASRDAHRAHSSSGSSDGDIDMEDADALEEGEDGAEEGKKHVCPTCAKRFNRPSSLRIHVNTHTGATPFRCPHPSCGRAFNVNSNMRRHFRNHAAPAFASSSSSFNNNVNGNNGANSPTSPSLSHGPFSPISPSAWSPSSPSPSISPSSSTSSASSSSGSRYSPPTPLSPLPLSLPLGLAHPWGKPRYAEGVHGHGYTYDGREGVRERERGYSYSESDVRSEILRR
ncbi:hypothetical protein B0H13DRAFT_2661976 [Mycena leptocephala]|nr:hypothetical protein B0H13DRAFT_2661976 [Mycena leptocephala]